jgi:hypothetical protein
MEIIFLNCCWLLTDVYQIILMANHFLPRFVPDFQIYLWRLFCRKQWRSSLRQRDRMKRRGLDIQILALDQTPLVNQLPLSVRRRGVSRVVQSDQRLRLHDSGQNHRELHLIDPGIRYVEVHKETGFR